MKNKKGMILGSFISLFVMTVIIILILVVFILGSGIVKKLDKADSGVAIYNESDVEIDNIFNYNLKYSELVEVRFLVEDGELVNEVFKEVDGK